MSSWKQSGASIGPSIVMFPASDSSSISVISRTTKSPYTCLDQYELITSLHILEEKDWQDEDAETTETTKKTKKIRETRGEGAISLPVEVGVVDLVASCSVVEGGARAGGGVMRVKVTPPVCRLRERKKKKGKKKSQIKIKIKIQNQPKNPKKPKETNNRLIPS